MPLYERSDCCNKPVIANYSKQNYLGSIVSVRNTECKGCKQDCETQRR